MMASSYLSAIAWQPPSDSAIYTYVKALHMGIDYEGVSQAIVSF